MDDQTRPLPIPGADDGRVPSSAEPTGAPAAYDRDPSWTYSWGPDTLSPAPRSHRVRRVALPALALALTLGAGGVGYAIGRPDATTPTAGAPSQTLTGGQPQTAPDQTQEGQAPDDQGFGSGVPQGQLPYAGDDPFGSQGQTPGGTGSGVDTSGDTSGTASSDQVVGLVRIATTLKYDGAKAAGTGMVLTSDGEVVTNHHVVAGATSIEVTVMSTGTTYTADVVGTDATADVAVLQLEDASGLSTVQTDTSAVGVGDAVTAVGDGEGTVDHLSAATGQVLATDQQITTQSEGSAQGESLTGLIQVSSDVVSGYSGGATYDADGEVVGMTTAASTGTADVVGYAVPIATVLRVADDLEQGVQDAAYAYGRPAFLGIGLGETGTTVQGAYDGTPAARAGIAQGDTITAVDGTAVTSGDQLRRLISSHDPGDSVEVTWTTAAGAEKAATVTLAEGPVA